MTISGAEHDPARQERVCSALAEAGVDSAVLSSIPSVAQAAGYWPIGLVKPP